MIVIARRPPARRLLLAVLVGGLLAGLVGMHHVAAAEAGPATTMTAHAPAADPMPPGADPHGDGHGEDGAALLHLCLAVLGAAAAAAVAVLVLRWRPAPYAAPLVAATRRVRTSPRAPPRGAPARLALLCVLRT